MLTPNVAETRRGSRPPIGPGTASGARPLATKARFGGLSSHVLVTRMRRGGALGVWREPGGTAARELPIDGNLEHRRCRNEARPTLCDDTRTTAATEAEAPPALTPEPVADGLSRRMEGTSAAERHQTCASRRVQQRVCRRRWTCGCAESHRTRQCRSAGVLWPGKQRSARRRCRAAAPLARMAKDGARTVSAPMR
jgi:hypothetical protein